MKSNHKLAAILLSLFTVLLFSSCISATEYAVEEKLNISYYPADHALDSDLTQVNLVIPQGVKEPPVLIWIGGGAWAYVNRHNEMDLSRQIAKHGIFVVSAGHRLSPALLGEEKRYDGIQHPEHVKDIARAFKWVYDQAQHYGYSTSNIFVGGFSSGAHLSTLLAADKRYLAEYGLTPQNINAIIPVAGGYDIPEYRELLIAADPSYEQNHINAVFGAKNEAHIDASPITFIESFNTPMLMFTESDTYQYATGFEQQLRDRGFRDFQVVNAYDETHASLWTNMSQEENYWYRNLIVDFILRKSNSSTD